MFKYFIAALLFILSFPSTACQITQSKIGNEYLISESCVLTPYQPGDLNAIPSSATYFVQYLFASSFQSYLNIKGDTQSKFAIPIASQPFNYGYRLFVGPVTLKQAKKALSELKRRGYRDALIKFYIDSSLPEMISIVPDDNEATSMAQTLTMPTMIPIFSLGGSTALLPVYSDHYQGKTTHYNDTYIGSFTYHQAQAVCHESNGRIASKAHYNHILSNMDFMMKYAAKSQFWLTPTQTITRIQHQVMTRQQSTSAYFNVICVTR